MAAMVETMFSVRQVPWHGLGKIVAEALNSEDALVAAGLDWDVVQSPVTVNGRVVPNAVANVRSDNDEVLGIVTERYTIVQNKDAFSFTDNLIGDGMVRYETAGSLRDGKQVWMLARLDEHREVLGDEVTPYMCFTNTHDGSGSVKVLMTPVRVVCNNTLNLALRGAKRTWSTVHVGKVEDKLREAQRTLELSRKYMDTLEEQAETLERLRVSDSDWKDIVIELFPDIKDASPRAVKTLEERREGLYKRFYAQDIQKFSNTGWAAVNAVTDYLAHVTPNRKTQTYQNNLFSGVIHGHHLLDKVTDLLKVA